MARIRSMKIGFFQNEELAQLPAHHRLCFAGLWLLADREGRLEDRPLRIKGMLFPYEQIDVDGVLSSLEAGRFIDRYEIDDERFIQVRGFLKHQRPRIDEPPSSIPAPLLEIPRGSVSVECLGKEGKGKEGDGEGGAIAPSAADGAETMHALWNTHTQPPIPRCREMSTRRRRAARARLTERPLTEWVEVFERIQASDFCRGTNERGWVASFDWVVGSPDVAVKVLEGKYDNRKAANPQPTARAVMGLVPQSPEMDDYHAQIRASKERQAAERDQKASA